MVALDVNKVPSVVWRSKDEATKGASSAGQESQAIVVANEHHSLICMFGGRPTVGGTLTLFMFYNAFSNFTRFSRGFWYVCVVQPALRLLTRSDLLLAHAAFTGAGERSIHPTAQHDSPAAARTPAPPNLLAARVSPPPPESSHCGATLAHA